MPLSSGALHAERWTNRPTLKDEKNKAGGYRWVHFGFRE
jgi:hypothetical protein